MHKTAALGALLALLTACASSPMPPYRPLPVPPSPSSPSPAPAPPAALMPPPEPKAVTSPIGNVPASPASDDGASVPQQVDLGLSAPLETQRSRLAEALAGTPVLVGASDQRQLRIEVPLRYCFDPGQTAVKPALAAVLDQLAIGFKPQAAVSEVRIGAPQDDPGGAPVGSVNALVQERAASMRDYLVARGVPVSRIAALGRSTVAGVEIAVADWLPDR